MALFVRAPGPSLCPSLLYRRVPRRQPASLTGGLAKFTKLFLRPYQETAPHAPPPLRQQPSELPPGGPVPEQSLICPNRGEDPLSKSSPLSSPVAAKETFRAAAMRKCALGQSGLNSLHCSASHAESALQPHSIHYPLHDTN